MKFRNIICLCLFTTLGLSCRLLAAGQTPSEVRAARMKAKNVFDPNDRQIRLIEAAVPEKAPATPAKPRQILVWGHSWTHQPNPYAEKALELLARKTG
ncbi:MAG: hypothetical protein JSW59_15625, partial [Phycisphaerales bacterium]